MPGPWANPGVVVRLCHGDSTPRGSTGRRPGLPEAPPEAGLGKPQFVTGSRLLPATGHRQGLRQRAAVQRSAGPVPGRGEEL